MAMFSPLFDGQFRSKRSVSLRGTSKQVCAVTLSGVPSSLDSCIALGGAVPLPVGQGSPAEGEERGEPRTLTPVRSHHEPSCIYSEGKAACSSSHNHSVRVQGSHSQAAPRKCVGACGSVSALMS